MQSLWRFVLRPVIVTGFIILILLGLSGVNDKITLSTPIGLIVTVISLLLTALFGDVLENVLKPVKRRFLAFSEDWPFIYKMYAHFESQEEPEIDGLIRFLSVQPSWKDRFRVAYRGHNFCQLEFASPSATLIIGFQPKYSYGDEHQDDDFERDESFTIEVQPAQTVTYWFRFRRAGKDLQETLRLVSEISHDLSRHLSGSNPSFTVNVNRYTPGRRIASKGPTHQGPPLRVNNLVIYKDQYAMQITSESSGDVKNHLFEGLVDLDPIRSV